MSNSTLTYSDGVGDCWADAVARFDNTDTILWIAQTNISTQEVRTWMPFVVNLARGTVVVSATLKIIASTGSAITTGNIKVGCEAADNPSAPTTGADVFARVMTTANNTVALAQYTLNTQYTYDVTNAVQEILNRSGWLSGNTLAVMIWDIDADKPHQVYSNEGGVNKPVLEIVVRSFTPRASGIL